MEEEHPLLSRFSLEPYKSFVESQKPPPIVADLKASRDDGAAMSVDVICCRSNAFAEAESWDIPIFAPKDSPVATIPGELGDYNLVDICHVDGRRKPVSMLPYFGPAWYSRASVAFLLDAGIAKWPDVRLTLNAAVRRPANYLSERLN